jgi:RNA-directed DNA polymerase
MPKKIGNIFDKIHDFESLYQAHLRARKGKRERKELLIFEQNLEENLIQLQKELKSGQYQTGKYRTFYISEPKKREVMALPYRDRVVQHAIVAAIEPIWEKAFIDHSYACRPQKGTHAGANHAQKCLRATHRAHGKIYALKGDIKKYFASINHKKLKELIAKKIKCQKTLKLCNEIIDSNKQESGIPLGNLTSQLFANIYLHELDQFAKHKLKLKKYSRYMDDFVAISHDKTEMQAARTEIEKYLSQELLLETNTKTGIYPIGKNGGRSIDYLGYRIHPNHRRIRKRAVQRIKKQIKTLLFKQKQGSIPKGRVAASIRSWADYTRHANASTIRTAVIAALKQMCQNYTTKHQAIDP